MVSKRQVEARKRFKKENPTLFPKPEPIPPKNPNKIKKMKNKFKKKMNSDNNTEKQNYSGEKRTSYSKHPMRVPGMKPGESCYICKGVDHIAKHCPEKAQWEKNKDPNKIEKKENKFKKRKNLENTKRENYSGGIRRSSYSKYPRRVPGMKPVGSCYICKGVDHIAKHCPEKTLGEKNKICLLCRHRGHSLKNCPQKNDEAVDKKMCYNCGETGHSLDKCPLPLKDGGTKFASCFICNQQGHLSKNCPKNSHGIYPKGGSCKVCGGVTHLARDCPNKGSNISNAVYGSGKISIGFVESRSKVIKFTSGDDLEDDFTIEDTSKTKPENKSAVTEIKDNNVIAKKKSGPKVVNFLG